MPLGRLEQRGAGRLPASPRSAVASSDQSPGSWPDGGHLHDCDDLGDRELRARPGAGRRPLRRADRAVGGLESPGPASRATPLARGRTVPRRDRAERHRDRGAVSDAGGRWGGPRGHLPRKRRDPPRRPASPPGLATCRPSGGLRALLAGAAVDLLGGTAFSKPHGRGHAEIPDGPAEPSRLTASPSRTEGARIPPGPARSSSLPSPPPRGGQAGARSRAVSSRSTDPVAGSMATPYSRRAYSAVSFSSRTSRRTRSGSRVSGSPKPPAPARTWRKTAPRWSVRVHLAGSS